MDNLDQFIAELDAIEAEIPRAHRDLQVALAIAAFSDIVDHSPVKSGAYRAEHVIGEGEALALRYEADNRPGPTAVVHVIGGALEPPDVGAAKAAISDVQPFGLVTIFNQRFYGPQLESGSSAQAPNGVYGPAADRLELLAESSDIDASRFERR